MSKILFVIDSLVSGGAQRQMVELAKGFKERGHEVIFITYHEINFFKPQLEKEAILVKTIEEPNYIKRLFKMRKAIRNEKPDAVLAFLQASSFIATFAGFPYRKWRLVVGERNAKPEILTSKTARLYRWFHLFPTYIVGNSHANIDLVKKVNPLLRKEKLKVIYNIVSIPEGKSVDGVTLNKEKAKVKVVIAARYTYQKNLEGLIEALKLLPEAYKSNLQIDWYGRKSEDNKTISTNQEKIEAYHLQNVIRLHDATTEIIEKYKQADFIALVSHFEGFPNTICEAMALKKPVIVSRVSDVPFFIKEEVNGFMCESRNSNSIKNAFIKAMDSTEEQRREMGINNYKIARKEFDKGPIVEKYLKLLQHEE